MEIISHIPGRLRIKIPSIYKNSTLASKLCSYLQKNESIYKVTFNTYTSKILVIYNSKENLLSDINSTIKEILQKNPYPIRAPKLYNNFLDNDRARSSIIIGKYQRLYSIIILSVTLLIRPDLAFALTLLFIFRKLILLTLEKYFRRKLKSHSGYKKTNYNSKLKEKKLEIFNAVWAFNNIIMPLTILGGILASLIKNDFLILIALLFLNNLESIYNSAHLALMRGYYNRLSQNVFLNKVDVFQDIANIDAIVFYNINNSHELTHQIIENLREKGIIYIYFFQKNNIEDLTYLEENFGITVIQENGSMISEITKTIEYLKSNDKTIALVYEGIDDFKDSRLRGHINILLSNKQSPKYLKHFDLIMDKKDLNKLGNTTDYAKYIVEIIYQNFALSIGINLISTLLVFLGKLTYLYTWIISIITNIVVYLNSLRALEYKLVNV